MLVSARHVYDGALCDDSGTPTGGGEVYRTGGGRGLPVTCPNTVRPAQSFDSFLSRKIDGTPSTCRPSRWMTAAATALPERRRLQNSTQQIKNVTGKGRSDGQGHGRIGIVPDAATVHYLSTCLACDGHSGSHVPGTVGEGEGSIELALGQPSQV